MALFGIYSYMTRRGMVGQYQLERRINATCSSPAVLADTMTLLVLVNLLLLRTCRTRRARLALALILPLQLVTIVLSGCRINLMLLAGAGGLWLLAWLWRMARRRLHHTLALVCVMLLACCAIVMVVRRLAPASVMTVVVHLPGIARVQDSMRRSARQDWHTALHSIFAGRQDHWSTAWDSARSQPLWGIGCGLFEQRYSAFRSSNDLFQFARVHNVYLRIVVEAGGMTALAGILAVVLTGVAWWRAMHGDVPAVPPVAVGYAAGLLVVLAAVAMTGLFSDLWYENPESIMTLGILSACAAASVRRATAAQAHARRALAPAAMKEPGQLDSLHGSRLQALVILLSRGHVTHVPWWKLGAVCVIGVAAAFGLGAAQQTARLQFLNGQTHFGIDTGASYAGPDTTWRAVRRNAVQAVCVTQPLLRLQWRALNERATVRAQNFSVWINDTRVAHTRLNSLQVHTLDCDVAALQGTVALISYRAQRTFQPWHEGWFVDARTSAALVREPQWLAGAPSNCPPVRAENGTPRGLPGARGDLSGPAK
jgi:O-antigen ligase